MRRPPPLPVPSPWWWSRRSIRHLRRSPATWWAAAVVVAIAALVRIDGLHDEASARRDAWGATVPVVVAVHDLAPGDTLAGADVRPARWPAAVVPAGALAELPAGQVVTAAIAAGEAVLATRITPDGLSAVAARIPPGHRAVTLPVDGVGLGDDPPPVSVGDRVDVLATHDGFDGFEDFEDFDVAARRGSEVVAEGALVLDVRGSAVTVAVPAGRAPALADAAARATITLALLGRP